MRNKLTYAVAGSEGLFKEGHWVYDLSTMPVDAYLNNATHYIDSKDIDKAIEQKKQANAKGKVMLCDSGGFQVATEVIKSLAPDEVIAVQNRVADIGMMLDRPTMRRVRGAGAGGLETDTSDEWCKHCLEISLNNIRKVKDLKKAFDYYAVIQGNAYAQQKMWWEAVKKEDVFEGLATKADLMEQVTIGCIIVHEEKILKHHILGAAAPGKLLVLRYFYLLSKSDMNIITIDSSNFVQYAKYMQMKMPFADCNYCKGGLVKDFEELSGVRFATQEVSDVLFVSVKNIYLEALHFNFINMLDTPAAVRDFVSKNFPAVSIYIQVIDAYFNDGIEKALKYLGKVTEQEVGKKRSNLMDFLK